MIICQNISARQYLLLIGVSVVTMLSGCLSTENPEEQTSSRANLYELAYSQEQKPLDELTLSKEQRTSKLTSLYQLILSTEPDPKVKAQLEYRLVQISSEVYDDIDFSIEENIERDNKGFIFLKSNNYPLP